jgi:hypothetical protein
MSQETLTLLAELGIAGKDLIMLYLLLDYSSLFIFFALVTWGIRAVWKFVKQMNSEE